jgi:hypothetical protein
MPRGGLILLASLTVAALTACDPVEHRCDDRLRMDILLGGGAPMCIGGPYAPPSGYHGGHFDDGEYVVGTDSVLYRYSAIGGHEGVLRWVGARVSGGCADFIEDSAYAAELPGQMMRKLGGRWERRPSGIGTRWVTARGNPLPAHIRDTVFARDTSFWGTGWRRESFREAVVWSSSEGFVVEDQSFDPYPLARRVCVHAPARESEPGPRE